MACCSANSQEYTGMLDSVIGIIELCTHTAHIAALAIHHHLCQKSI
ncbi:hypothetical protein EVA_16409 [gut metagenome]|uniref:Uncharacterized protein n=1 Tax=gut metagenome TaxID=749906 RepID=J9G7P6_9ZZZZ